MKSYQMFYIIKKNNEVILNHMFVIAKNLKEAKQKVKQAVRERTEKNAFGITSHVEDIAWRCTIR